MPVIAAERIPIGNLSTLPQVITKYGDVNVFGKAGNEAKCLGERGAALEQQAAATSLQTVKQSIQCPTDPEILLDVLNRCTKAS